MTTPTDTPTHEIQPLTYQGHLIGAVKLEPLQIARQTWYVVSDPTSEEVWTVVPHREQAEQFARAWALAFVAGYARHIEHERQRRRERRQK